MKLLKHKDIHERNEKEDDANNLVFNRDNLICDLYLNDIGKIINYI